MGPGTGRADSAGAADAAAAVDAEADSDAARTRALRRLAPAYARALRLRDSDVRDDEIARLLGIEPEAVGPLLTVAEAKLAAALRDECG